ncbi:hypothetical protein RvY_07839 [Ramazzottius varieornatus]|uniref:Uncharacterized protein n=1 Tax=Ramazzottius varieornatus TaxID=947166 RepID=A0A1D1V3N3_RAMVA|nr:hypothetical protein RvY_07839 [Ramazzottius varieornatus]
MTDGSFVYFVWDMFTTKTAWVPSLANPGWYSPNDTDYQNAIARQAYGSILITTMCNISKLAQYQGKIAAFSQRVKLNSSLYPDIKPGIPFPTTNYKFSLLVFCNARQKALLKWNDRPTG